MIADHDIQWLTKPDFWKKKPVPEFGPNEPETTFFCHFLKLASLVLLDIVYNDSLQQCGTSSRSKFHLKNVGSQISTKGAKIEPKTSFFLPFSHVLLISFLWNITQL